MFEKRGGAVAVVLGVVVAALTEWKAALNVGMDVHVRLQMREWG